MHRETGVPPRLGKEIKARWLSVHTFMPKEVKFVKQRVSRRDFFKFFGLGASENALLSSAAAVPAPAGTDADKPPTFHIGPVKINKAQETASVCAFCEAGCGIIVYSDEKGERVLRDPDNPNSEGCVCPRDIALDEAGVQSVKDI